MRQPLLRIRVEVNSLVNGYLSYEIRSKTHIVEVGTCDTVERIGRSLNKYILNELRKESEDAKT